MTVTADQVKSLLGSMDFVAYELYPPAQFFDLEAKLPNRTLNILDRLANQLYRHPSFRLPEALHPTHVFVYKLSKFCNYDFRNFVPCCKEASWKLVSIGSCVPGLIQLDIGYCFYRNGGNEPS